MVKLLTQFLLVIAVFTAASIAKYSLAKDYSGFDFVSNFDYYNGPDPTNGHVQYKGYATANATGLTGFLVGPNGTNVNDASLAPPVYLGVDYTNIYPINVGRPSTRISSVETYNHSLIIADILHMPSSTCGVWPAFWMLGIAAPWPDAGEIDIIENVNENNFNMMTLHTNAGVKLVNNTSLLNGTAKTYDCDVNAKDQDKNAGCTIIDAPETNSYGTKFNSIDAGVFAMQYTAHHIAIWFFPRNAIPDDIKSNKPVPHSMRNATGSRWGKPNALFYPLRTSTMPLTSTNPTTATKAAAVTVIPVTETSTAPTTGSSATVSYSTKNTDPNTILSKHFNSLQILFSTTFCGEWAGKIWATSSCGRLAPTCEEYVSKNPAAFADAYWAIQSVKVYLEE